MVDRTTSPLVFRNDSRPPTEAVGRSEAFLRFQERLSRAARVDRPVLLVGERGTGKELAAARLHYLSARWEHTFMALNCAALERQLLSSELFGHEAGAYTGASARRAGRFELAHRGTLFLDEIANMSMDVQEKILRVVEYGTFERLGGAQTLHADVRLVGATNADLPELVRRGEFKADLLDRLSFEVLTLPPLRARTGDVHVLTDHFAARMAAEIGLEGTPEFSRTARQQLEEYSWPGNVRQLKSVVERAVYRSEDGHVDEVQFDPFASPWRPEPDRPGHRAPAGPENAEGAPPLSGEDASYGGGPLEYEDTGRLREREHTGSEPARVWPLREAVRALEVDLLRRALDEARHNQREAAQKLGLSYHQFRGLYRKYKEELDY